MLWCTGEAGKVVVPVVKGRHVIPTGKQIPNTPLLAMAAHRPSTGTEPAGTVQCYPHGEPDPQHSSPCHGGTQAQYRAGRYSTVLSSLGTRSPTLLSSPWRHPGPVPSRQVQVVSSWMGGQLKMELVSPKLLKCPGGERHRPVTRTILEVEFIPTFLFLYWLCL